MSNQNNIRLCRAVQLHPCLYDHSRSVTREAYDRAWLEVAKLCEETVVTCKQRWRNICEIFARSHGGSPKKRKGNRAREPNLHDVLEFLIPHLNNGADATSFRDSEAESVTKQAQKDTVDANNTNADDGFLEESEIKREVEELNEDNTNELAVGEEPCTEDDKAEVLSSRRPPSARLRVLRKTSEDVKETENNPAKKTQSLAKPVNAEDDSQNMVEVRLPKSAQISKSKVGTFYISPPNSDADTFYTNQTNASNELEDTTENEGNMPDDESVFYEYELNESTQQESGVQDPIKARQCRPKRACKRGLGKKTSTIRDLRQKDTVAKSVRRNAAHLKSLGEATKQLIMDNKLTRKTGNTPTPSESQGANIAGATRTRTLCIPQSDTTKAGAQQRNSLSPVIKLTRYDANYVQAYADQGVQCSLQPTSSDDDFFDTLKPYLSEMNARQKLHFKKKIYESLMEVFDSTSEFPANVASQALIPKQLSAVSDDELHLVRELVALVQAAKHTPELNLNLSGGSDSELASQSGAEKCAMISTTVATRCNAAETPPPAQAPLSLRVTPFNTTTTVATSTQTKAATPSTPLVQRRVFRKLVKVDELGAASACNMPTTSAAYAAGSSEILHRRVYRIFPKTSVNNGSLENAVNASSVGTFIVPRSNAEARCSSTATNQSAAAKAGRIPPTIRVGARPIVRRYSLCGALQNFDAEQSAASHSSLTTTANTKSPVSTTPKITIAHRCSPANVASREVFKLPTPFRSIITSANAIVSGVATNTTTSRTTPLVSVSAGRRSSAVRTVPYNKFTRNDEKTTVIYQTKSSSNTKTVRDASSSSHVVGNKRPIVATSEVVGKRNRPYTERRIVDEAVVEDLTDKSVFASDEVDLSNIKTEPADDIN